MRIKRGAEMNADNAAHFRALAARIMRQLLVEHARSHGAAKRGGDAARVTLMTDLTPTPDKGIDFIELEEALAKLSQLDRRLVDVVELRFYGGMTIEETANALKISATVVKDDWRTARALITKFMTKGD